MKTILMISGCVLLVAGLWYLYQRVQTLVDGASQKQAKDKGFSEAVQSITAALLIMLASLVLLFIHLPLLYLSVLAMAIMYSGTRALRKSVDGNTVRELAKDLRFGAIMFLFGMFLVSLTALPGMKIPGQVQSALKTAAAAKGVLPETTVVEVVRVDTVVVAPAPQVVEAETDTMCTVIKVGYVRAGPSKTDRILGLSIKNSKARVLQYDAEYYEVSGKYIEGKSGKGPVREGTYWIGMILVDR